MQVLIDAIRFITLSQLVLLIILLLKIPKKRQQHWLTLFFVTCLSAYLLAYWPPIINSKTPFYSLLPFSVALPLSFWLFSKTLFDDSFKWKSSYTFGFLIIIAIHTLLYLLNSGLWETLEGDWKNLAKLPPYLISLLFVLLGLLEGFKNYKGDLILARLKLRAPFIIASATVMFLTLASLMTLQHDNLPLILELVQKVMIGVLVFYFSFNQLKLNENYFKAKENNINRFPKNIDKKLLEKIQFQLESEKIYRREGLTISSLSQLIEEKEYKVRRIINQHLGFKNFNTFINSYRIKDACTLLSNSEDKALNVTEIAYECGYTSLTTFNKTFKEITGLTPSAYRKKHR